MENETKKIKKEINANRKDMVLGILKGAYKIPTFLFRNQLAAIAITILASGAFLVNGLGNEVQYGVQEKNIATNIASDPEYLPEKEIKEGYFITEYLPWVKGSNNVYVRNIIKHYYELDFIVEEELEKIINGENSLYTNGTTEYQTYEGEGIPEEIATGNNEAYIEIIVISKTGETITVKKSLMNFLDIFAIIAMVSLTGVTVGMLYQMMDDLFFDTNPNLIEELKEIAEDIKNNKEDIKSLKERLLELAKKSTDNSRGM